MYIVLIWSACLIYAIIWWIMSQTHYKYIDLASAIIDAPYKMINIPTKAIITGSQEYLPYTVYKHVNASMAAVAKL